MTSASPSRRTRLPPAERRAQLIELGVRMLATRTLDELSVEDLAAAAGISRGLLFHYFSSKQEFHTEVARAAAADLLVRTEPDPAVAPIDALRGALRSFIDYVAENPDNYKSLVRGAAAGDAAMRAIFDETRATFARRIVTVLEDYGLTMPARARLAVHGWVAFAEECVIRAIDDGLLAGPAGDGAAGGGAADLLELLTASLPAVLLSTGEHDPAVLFDAMQAARALGGQAGGERPLQ